MGISIGIIITLWLISFILFSLLITSVIKDWPFIGIISAILTFIIWVFLGPIFITSCYSSKIEIVDNEIEILKTNNTVLVTRVYEKEIIIETFDSHVDYLRIDSNTIFIYDISYNYYGSELSRIFKIQD